jgi:hypothetical protein
MDLLILPEARNQEIKFVEFVTHWIKFVGVHLPGADALSRSIAVGSENVRFDMLRRRNGFDAMCRELSGRRDRRQITREFWRLNGHFFERGREMDEGTGRVIDVVSLSKMARDKFLETRG